MATCRNCRKSVKWLEVPKQTAAGTLMQFQMFDAKTKPYRPHVCAEKKKTSNEVEKSEPRVPWWIDRD